MLVGRQNVYPKPIHNEIRQFGIVQNGMVLMIVVNDEHPDQQKT
jgi:hypothetical protein